MGERFVLDVTCGGRMMWFDKTHPNTVYFDRRTVKAGTIEQQPSFTVAPDVVGDYANLPFRDGAFKMVVFDPPHAPISEGSIIGIKYGTLGQEWETTLSDGFTECWRVLSDFGVLVFKWNETEVTVKEVISLAGLPPLFGHTTAKSGKTKWVTFMKIPSEARRNNDD